MPLLDFSGCRCFDAIAYFMPPYDMMRRARRLLMPACRFFFFFCQRDGNKAQLICHTCLCRAATLLRLRADMIRRRSLLFAAAYAAIVICHAAPLLRY